MTAIYTAKLAPGQHEDTLFDHNLHFYLQINTNTLSHHSLVFIYKEYQDLYR